MKLIEIYEKVHMKMPLEERRFFNYFNDTVAELLSAVPPRYVTETGKRFEPMYSLNTNIEYAVRPLYAPAIVDNILYMAGYDSENAAFYKQEFIRKAQEAYKTYWNHEAVTRRGEPENPILMIEEMVNVRTPIDQRRFFDYLNETVTELMSIVPPRFVLKEGKSFEPIYSADAEWVIRPLYTSAIADNILYKLGFDQNGSFYKSEFVRKSNAAYLTYWNDHAHGKKYRHVLRNGW